jgi:outer membrane protein assembly factor BamD
MFRRFSIIVLFGALALATACTNKKVVNPIANVDSKQPDKVLFDRAMDAMKHSRYDVARLTLQTLINTYPDSEYIARAKLSLADSWYDEGGAASLTEAENEYNDFKTFFPNMPEAAEAQLKIANIHFQQMEKPDRDYTHAMRAEEEYRNMITQFPDSKLVPEAKRKLMQVQELLASREFEVGRFYFLRASYPAAIARLKTLVDRYPLYSKADEALYLLGQSYEGEIALLRQRKFDETVKARMIDDFTKRAAAAYDQILTRYPLLDRADDAKRRLTDLKQPIPRPTKAAVAQNKAEMDSRHDSTTLSKVMHGLGKRPDVSQAATKGEPTMVDPEPMSPTEVAKAAGRAASGPDNHTLSVETTGTGAPPPSDAAPRSDTPAAADTTAPTTGADAAASSAAGVEVIPENNSNAAPDPNELKPDAATASAGAAVSTDPNELKPNVAQDSAPLPAPSQVNEISGSSAQTTSSAANTAPDQQPADDKDISSSKHKKKAGLQKLNPF